MRYPSAYPRVYAMLKNAGHNPAKAAEIILDARRKDKWALAWIRILHTSELQKGK